MLDDQTHDLLQKPPEAFRPEAYTIAQSIILGLVIASVAIGVGPLYGIIVAAGGAAATLIAGLTMVNEDEVLELVPFRMPSQKTLLRLRAMRRGQLIGSSLDEAGH